VNQPARQPTPGELSAYALGYQLALGPRIRRTQVVRREVHLLANGDQVLVEETNYIEETY
jgi:hypothetical protein